MLQCTITDAILVVRMAAKGLPALPDATETAPAAGPDFPTWPPRKDECHDRTPKNSESWRRSRDPAVRIPAVRPAQVRPAQVRPAQVRLAQIRLAQIRAAQRRTAGRAACDRRARHQGCLRAGQSSRRAGDRRARTLLCGG